MQDRSVDNIQRVIQTAAAQGGRKESGTEKEAVPYRGLEFADLQSYALWRANASVKSHDNR